jgi:peptidoglycan/xylan/chitin deacetylase (PgdA/CDA1 family)
MLGWFTPTIFLGPAQRRLSQRGLLIFAYHKIAPRPRATTDPYLYVSPERFARQLAALQRAGYASTSLDQFAPSFQSSLANQQPSADGAANPAGSRDVVLTFDDGCANVLAHGLEALARYHFRAMQFLVPGFLGRVNEWDVAKGDVPEALMDEAQVRDWLAAGHEIGSHSMTHRNLRHLSPAEAREEIAGSKKALEDRFGLAVKHFCYPYGSWNEAVRDIVAEAGYQSACTLVFGVNPSATPRFELRRIFPLSSAELLGKIRHRLSRRISRGRL